MNSEVLTSPTSARPRRATSAPGGAPPGPRPRTSTRRVAVAAIDWPSSEIELTMSRWRGASVSRSLRASLSACGSSASGAARKSSKSSIGSTRRRAAAAHRVDDLVPRDRVDPGRKRLPGVPGMALEMDRQQGLLHRILDIRVPHPGARETRRAPSPAPTGRSPPAAAGMRPRRPRSRPSSSETRDRPEDPRRTGLSYGLRFVSSAVTGPGKYFARSANGRGRPM